MKITIKDINAKRLNVGDTGFYVLAIPDEKQFYDFWIMHDKHETALHMFGTTRAKAPDDATLFYIASEGWKLYAEEYLRMIEREVQQ